MLDPLDAMDRPEVDVFICLGVDFEGILGPGGFGFLLALAFAVAVDLTLPVVLATEDALAPEIVRTLS